MPGLHYELKQVWVAFQVVLLHHQHHYLRCLYSRWRWIAPKKLELPNLDKGINQVQNLAPIVSMCSNCLGSRHPRRFCSRFWAFHCDTNSKRSFSHWLGSGFRIGKITGAIHLPSCSVVIGRLLAQSLITHTPHFRNGFMRYLDSRWAVRVLMRLISLSRLLSWFLWDEH